MNPPRPSPLLHQVTRRLSGLLGIDAAIRRDVITGMSHKPPGDSATYWLQLALSAGIATLGLVLNSAGVIIGAMLIAPLMTPIIELAMGLVVTSSSLVVHGLGRALASIVFVIGGAALITIALPFHQPTGELLARTAPTVLDLVVALFCAIAGGAVTARPSPAGASTAAGTAIGISLVPPLCACGFGLGTGDMLVAEGAMLLFIANVCAILTFAGLFFAAVGFGASTIAVDARPEPETGAVDHWKQVLIRRLDWALAQPHGAALRVVIPVVLLAAVLVPLTRALREVTYEVRTRAAVARLVEAEPLLTDALQMTTDVQRGTVRVHAVVVGSDADGRGLERRLHAALVGGGALAPLVRVRAVPAAGVVARPEPAREAAAPIDLVSPGDAADKLAETTIGAIRRRWPSVAGRIVAARVEIEESGALGLAVTTLGEPVDAAARAVLAATVGEELGRAVGLRVHTLPAAPIAHGLGDADQWWARVTPLLPVVAATPAVSLCLTVPTDAVVRRVASARQVRRAVFDVVASPGETRVQVDEADGWRARVVVGACAPPTVSSAAGASR